MEISFTDKIEQYIKNQHLAVTDDIILVGLSGGADSVALLLLLTELGYKCIAVHCNFHLRDEESNRDEQFCRDLCAALGIQLLTKDFDIDATRKATGESVEMACRSSRYNWWQSLIASGVADKLAVGHHIEDNIETFFINMLRGSGLQGLKGMLPKSGNIIRPLLESTRTEIEQYLAYRGVGYVTDRTNAENEYRRNRIRNIILPELEKCFPGAAASINKTISCLRGNYELYSDSVENLRTKYLYDGKGIDLSRIATEEQHPRMVLFELLYSMGFNMTHVDNILATLDDNGKCDVSGKFFKSEEITLLLDRGYLIPYNSGNNSLASLPEEVSLTNPPFSFTIIPISEFERLKRGHELSTESLYLDAIILDCQHKFTLRNWQTGDRFKPFGMRGSKLLSDLFSDAKLSIRQKERTKVLLCDDTIIWVVGLRASRHFAVKKGTKSVLVLNYND